MARDHTEVTDATRQAEEEESAAAHEPDRAPTPGEEAAAEELSVDPDVREHYEEMAERGAEAEGEGRVP
ncbi:MAG TPA: hypothetical protein VLZ77_13040 [Acidimicrobiales bacterium]|nr:hypothetical protein [Acidimicrobiales bacterium]